MLILLGSSNYFKSSSCKREVAAAMSESKPLVLLHEADWKKNGTRVSRLKEACCTKHCEFVFGADNAPRPVIPWLRIQEFQRVSLKLVAEELVRASPTYNAVDISSLLPLPRQGPGLRVEMCAVARWGPHAAVAKPDGNHMEMT